MHFPYKLEFSNDFEPVLEHLGIDISDAPPYCENNTIAPNDRWDCAPDPPMQWSRDPTEGYQMPNGTIWITGGCVSIRLHWSLTFGATVYYIFRSNTSFTSPDGLTPIGLASSFSCYDEVCEIGTYFYAVVAGNPWANSSLSNLENISILIWHPDNPGIPAFVGLPLLFALFALIVLERFRPPRNVSQLSKL